ncbi:MAG: YHS domain protein [Chitinophagaceae bacterium]|nr:MAG: YHS domain protein [Chitinophagaceae bacterium]
MKIKCLLTILVTLTLGGLEAQTAEVRTKEFNLSSSQLAIEGYDPVSYFNGKPAEGSSKFTAVVNGVKYQFANAANRDKFIAMPAKYEPQYGGWCAYAMGLNGEKVEVDPETYKILDGKLYLFYNRFFNNTLKTWNKDEKKLQSNADKNFKKIIQ